MRPLPRPIRWHPFREHGADEPGDDRRAERFHWAVGIEDTFVPQPSRSGRVVDEYELTGHYHSWRDDLRPVASKGVRVIRYGIPWCRVNPAPSRFDWSWTHRVLGHLERLGIDPIIDLVHYGTPLWLGGSFANPD